MAATEAETVFRSEAWLRSEALTDETVLDYFALSPFYDGSPSANLNERARASGMHPWSESALAQMRASRGCFDYALAWSSPPHAFVVRKRNREAPSDSLDRCRSLSLYYVLDGSVYAAPSLHSVLLCRLARCSYNARSALATLAGSADSDPAPARAADQTSSQPAASRNPSSFDAAPMHSQTLDGIIASTIQRHFVQDESSYPHNDEHQQQSHDSAAVAD